MNKMVERSGEYNETGTAATVGIYGPPENNGEKEPDAMVTWVKQTKKR